MEVSNYSVPLFGAVVINTLFTDTAWYEQKIDSLDSPTRHRLISPRKSEGWFTATSPKGATNIADGWSCQLHGGPLPPCSIKQSSGRFPVIDPSQMKRFS